jgi:hypothetical protein
VYLGGASGNAAHVGEGGTAGLQRFVTELLWLGKREPVASGESQ